MLRANWLYRFLQGFVRNTYYTMYYLKTLKRCSFVRRGSSPGRLGCTIRCDIVVILLFWHGWYKADDDENVDVEVTRDSLWALNDVVLLAGEILAKFLSYWDWPSGFEDIILGEGTFKQRWNV